MVNFTSGTSLKEYHVQSKRERADADSGGRVKVIYIAGKYRDTRGEWFVVENIRKAAEAAISVWQLGGVALCPHKNTALFGGVPGCPDEVWLEGDLELLKRCDAVYAIDGWRESTGAMKEVEVARSNNIPVLYTPQDVIDFLRGQ